MSLEKSSERDAQATQGMEHNGREAMRACYSNRYDTRFALQAPCTTSRTSLLSSRRLVRQPSRSTYGRLCQAIGIGIDIGINVSLQSGISNH